MIDGYVVPQLDTAKGILKFMIPMLSWCISSIVAQQDRPPQTKWIYVLPQCPKEQHRILDKIWAQT